MADTLVIRFRGEAADTLDWVAVDVNGALVGEPGHGDPMAAAEAAVDSGKVIVIVPAASVLRTTAVVPVRGAAKVLQALPFAMEEQLATDVDALHFAAGKRDADGRLPVAAVERLEIESWLELLAAAGISPSAMYADSDAVSAIPNTTTLFVEGDSLLLRGPDGSIAVTDPDGAEATLQLWLKAHETEEDEESAALPPLNLLVYQTESMLNDPAIGALIAGVEPQVASVDVRVLADGALARLASQIVTEPGVNLLQGRYAPRSNLAIYWPAWRGAAILLACLVGVVVGAKLLEIAELRREAASLDAAIEQAIRYTFPEVREVRDARALLQSKLRGLRVATGAGGATEFLDTLQAVASALPVSDSTTIDTINYRSGVMELRVTAPNVEALDAIQKQIVKTQGLEAEIQSANPEGDKVRGRIQIRSAGA